MEQAKSISYSINSCKSYTHISQLVNPLREIQLINLKILKRTIKAVINLFIFEAGSDIAKLLIHPKPLLLFVLTIPYITDEH